MPGTPDHGGEAAYGSASFSSSFSEDCVEELVQLDESLLLPSNVSSFASLSNGLGPPPSELVCAVAHPSTRIEVWYQSGLRVSLLVVWKNKVFRITKHTTDPNAQVLTQLITELPSVKPATRPQQHVEQPDPMSQQQPQRQRYQEEQQEDGAKQQQHEERQIEDGQDDDKQQHEDQEQEDVFREEITDAQWLHAQLVCVGYASGFVRVFDSETRRLVYEQKLHTASVKNLSVHASFLNPTASLDHNSQQGNSNFMAQTDPGKSLWILYTDATVVMVQLSDVLHGGSSQATKFRKYSFRDQSQVLSAIPCGSVRPSVFQSHARLGVYNIVSVGSDPFVAFYQAGNDQSSIVHLAHLATAIATRAAGAVWSFATSWRWGSSTSSQDAADANGDEGGSSAADPSSNLLSANSTAAAEHVAAPLTATRWMPEDSRRRCRMCVVSPTGRLALIADTLGRVLLLDTSSMTVIRLWKGYRNAQCGWMHGREGFRSRQGLYMVIYSEQRGIVEIWRARFGPRVFMLPVGLNARIFTHVDDVTRKAKCLLLANRGNESGLSLLEINAHAPNSTVLMKYFTQNKLQEENFVLHQILGELNSLVKKRTHSSRRKAVQTYSKPSSADTEPLSVKIVDEMASLTSPTTVQTLVEVLFRVEMDALDAEFLLKCIDTLLETLRSSLSSHAPSGSELSTLWQLIWKRCLIATYIGLRKEFTGCYNLLQARAKATATDGDDLDLDKTSYLLRLRAWMELYRRANGGLDGTNEDKKVLDAFETSCQHASRLTCLEFLRFFAMPFDDPNVLTNRDLLSHCTTMLQQQQQQQQQPAAAMKPTAEVGQVFLKNAFDSLHTPVLKPSMAPSMRNTFLTFSFLPILSNVFAVEEIVKLHDQMLLSPLENMHLFVEWFFSLPLNILVSLPAPSSSSSLQRWLQPLITSLNTQEAIDASQEDSEANEYESVANERHSLPLMASRLGDIFQVCCNNVQLFHGFLLAVHCEWGEKQHARQLEEHTLGEFSAEASGMRWHILQECISKTVHLSLRLGKMGRLSVQAAESVDEIMRTIALMKLNDEDELVDPSTSTRDQEHQDPLASIAVPPQARGGSLNDQDAWISSMEMYRNARQMRSLASISNWFPQFFDPDALNCFQIVILCAAWNAERVEMHQLDEAVGLVSWIRHSKIRAAMANLVWEKYLRMHVVTLVSFWEETVTGKKTNKGLQPQIARHLFSIIKRLLKEYLMAVQDLKLKPLVSPRRQPSGSYRGDDDEADHDDDAQQQQQQQQQRDEEEEADEEEELDDEYSSRSMYMSKASDKEASIWTMETLLTRNMWNQRVQRLPQLFHKHWPPSHTQSLLWRILDGFDEDAISVQQIQDHLSLILLLDAFAATNLVPVSITRLFINKGATLCRVNTFALVASEEKERASNQKELTVLQQQRSKLLYQLLRLDVGACYELAESFGYPLDPFRQAFVVFLYQTGQDALADDAFGRLQPPFDLQVVPSMVAIARARLAIIFERMQLAPEFAPIMCLVPADTLRWITSDLAPFERDQDVVKMDPAPSWTSTSVLLAKCMQYFAPESVEFKKISEMLVLVKNVVDQLSRTSHVI